MPEPCEAALFAHSQRPRIAARVLLVAAHPDDETVGVGAQLHRCDDLILLHLTDGAPRNLADARRHGFDDAPSYGAARARELHLYAIGLAAVGMIWVLIQLQDMMGGLLMICGLAMLGYTLFEAFKLPKEPRERIFAILFLIALNPLFWGLFEQVGGSLTLYTDRYVDRQGVPASLFQTINPIYILLLAPLFAGLWSWLGRRGLEPSAPAKFALALAQVTGRAVEEPTPRG